MDPNKVLAKLIEAAYAGDGYGVRDAAADLADWLQRGGFPPHSHARPVCKNCDQWADGGDCFNQCAKRGFA